MTQSRKQSQQSICNLYEKQCDSYDIAVISPQNEMQNSGCLSFLPS